MNVNEIYIDFWELLGRYLPADDLYNFSITCKAAYKAFHRPTIQRKMSYPMLHPYKLTYEQRQLVKSLERGYPEFTRHNYPSNHHPRFKLIHGDVGSGKTITSLSYAIRNYNDPDSKIVMCGPPSLVKMWWDTLIKYFGTEPFVFHAINPKYSATNSFKTIPENKFILISYKIFQMHQRDCHEWFDDARDLLIIDEAHHHVLIPYRNFKEVIGLSATTTKKSGLSRGIRSILRTFSLDESECTYTLNKSVIARKLPPVKYHSYLIPTEEELMRAAIRRINYTVKGYQDLKSASDICQLLSHPVILDLYEQCTGGFITVGRKKFKVEVGKYSDYVKALRRVAKEEGISCERAKKEAYRYATYDINKSGLTYGKYVQVYHIIKWANSLGEKVLLFDNSTTYLPFLYKFLKELGVNSYIFSSHYGVNGRQKQLSKFKEDSEAGVLLSSIAMLGEGHNVTEANHVIFLSHCLESSKYYQAVGRCWRYPQEKTVHVHLVFGGLFDQKVYEYACSGEDFGKLDWIDLLHQK